MLYESGRKSSDVMPFVQLSSSTRYLFAGQSGMKQGKIDWGIRDAAGRKILLLTRRNDPNFVSSSSELIKTHNTNAL